MNWAAGYEQRVGVDGQSPSLFRTEVLLWTCRQCEKRRSVLDKQQLSRDSFEPFRSAGLAGGENVVWKRITRVVHIHRAAVPQTTTK